MKKFLLIMLGVLLALPGIARDFTYEYEGQTLTYTVIDEDAKTCKTKDGRGDNAGNIVSGALVIPSDAKDGDIEFSVTSIGFGTFYKCSGLTSVTIPNSVTEIGRSAFSKCSGLTSVTIPNSVNSIGVNAFYGCSSLTSVTIPNSVTSIGFGTFYNCSGLTSVTIPNSVTSIGEEAFSGCSGLTSVIIPNSVTSIYGNTFNDCTGLRKSAYPSGLSDPFSNGTAIQYPREGAIVEDGFIYGPEKNAIYFAPLSLEGEYVIPNTVNSIGEYAFSNCSGLTSVTIPNSVMSIGDYTFCDCSGLTSVTIPNSVTEIGVKAFIRCSGLTSVTIPNSVPSIGDYTFSGCSGLTSVTIPNSVSLIGEWAFYDCSGLKTLTVEDGQSLIAFGKNALNQAPIEHLYIGRNWSDASGGAISTGIKSVEIGNSVTELPDNAFSGCSGLTSVTIPNSVTSIGKYAFYKCTGLKTFIVEDGENPIAFEYNALYQAPIEHLYIGRNWSDASEGAISTGIKSVEIGNSVTELPDCAFYSCTGLTSVTIPNSVISIGERAFYDCSGLTSVTIPNSITSIGNSTFTNCFDLTSVTIPTSVTSIGEKAFYGCYGLTSVIIPNSVATIGGEAFSGCYGLEKSAYPSGLYYPFYHDVIAIEYPREEAIIEDGFVFGPEKNAIYFAPLSLEGEYVIPNTVNSIGEYAFSNCSGLTSVTIPNSVTSIGEKAFSGCSGLTSVIIPNSVTSIYGNTFNRCSGLRKSAYPSGLSDPFSNGTAIQYPREGAIVEDGFIYGPEKNAIYFAPLSLEGEYVIPNSVMSIGDLAFSGCSGLTSVKTTTINPPVMNDNSFEGLYDTAALSVPEDAVTDYLATNWSLFENLRIGDSETAAQTYETGNLKYMLIPGKTQEDKNLAVVIPGDYSSLTQVTIPERFTVSDNGTNTRYFVDGIGFKAFNGCSGLATVTFNSRNASKAIGDYAFAGTKISELTIPATVESIGTHAFDGCKSLTGIVIPGSVGTIGDYAFNGCTALTNANLETGVEAIGNHAFDGCKSLTGIVIPGSVRTIGDYAFNECIALTNANLEAGVKSIGDYAFYNTPLKEITLNEGLETIGEYCFSASGDRAIEPVYIPSSLTSVGADAFMNFNCRYVNISDLTAWCNIDFGNENSNPAAHRQGLYLNGEKIEDLVIPESVNAIKDYAFCFNSTLKSVEFNDALQSIGKNAFKGCNGLTAAVIPGDVTVIGDNAFASTNVHDLTFAYGAKPIEVASNAFNIPTSLSWDRPIESLNLGISSLESLTIGNSVTEIPAAKFKGIASLTSLTLGNSLTAISDEAFSGCTALTEVILPPSVETVGASAFAGNNKLASIIMGHKVTTIGEKAYDLCPAQTVSITAQTPPTAPDNTFSNYTGSLYVQGQTAADAYYDADYCWYQFEGHVMIEPTEIRTEGDKTLSGKPGDTFQLTATLWPENVTLPQVFWRSTNPDIATVDANGLVTLHADMSGVMAMAEGDGDTDSRSCKIIAESLYADGPVAEFTVNDTSIPTGIDDVVNDSTPSGDIDFSAPVEVYNLQGARVADSMQNLANGIYIVRQGDNVKKIAVR